MSLALEKGKPLAAPRISLEKMFPGGIFIGLIGVLVLIGIILTSTGTVKSSVAGSYLFAWIFWVGLSIGCFGFLALYHTVQGKYMVPGLRIFEAGGGPIAMLVMFLLFLPISIPVLLHQHYLYVWVDPHLQATDALLKWKAPYLNTTGWFVRTFIWFGSWIAISGGLIASTKRQEKTGSIKELKMRNNWGAPALIWFFLSITFCMTDWVMSLDYRWFSTMWGLWSAIAVGIGAFSFATMIVCSNMDKDQYRYVGPNVTRDMANILFVLAMLWAYTSFGQYLIIWSGNLPETNFYFVERSNNGWNAIGMTTMVGEYFIPFVALLTPRNRKVPRNLAFIGGFMLVMHLVDVYIYVMPAIRQNGPMPTGWDVLALLSIGLVWLGVVAGVMRKYALLPAFDTRLEDAAHGH